MFDIGATELLVVAVVMILVVGPKELPGMLRNIGRMVKKVRSMAGDFQSQFDDALKEAELDGVKDTLQDVKSMNPMSSLKNELNPINKLMEETKADLNDEASKVTKAIEGEGEGESEGGIEKSPSRQSESGSAKTGSAKTDAAKTDTAKPMKPKSAKSKEASQAKNEDNS